MGKNKAAYRAEKRQKELKRLKKQEEKREKRMEKSEEELLAAQDEETGQPEEPPKE